MKNFKNSSTDKLQKYLFPLIGRNPTNEELREIQISLEYLIKAKIAYLHQKKGDPHVK